MDSRIFMKAKLLFLFSHGFYASGADILRFTVDFFNLQINILSAHGFYIGMGPGGVAS